MSEASSAELLSRLTKRTANYSYRRAPCVVGGVTWPVMHDWGDWMANEKKHACPRTVDISNNLNN